MNPEKHGRTIISRYDFKRPAVKAGYGIIAFYALVVAATMLYPLLWIVFGGFKNSEEANAIPPKLLPRVWEWSNFGEVVRYIDYAKFMSNTLLIFVCFILIKLVVVSMGAYALSVLRLPFKRFFLLYFLATLMVPGMTLLIPKYLTLQQLGFIDTYWGLWIDAGADGFGLFLLKSFFDGVSHEMLEAARMDGASETRVFWSMMLPMCKPVLATLTIFAFTYVWNDFFWPLLVLPTQDKWPIATKAYYVLFAASGSSTGGTLTLNIRFGILTLITVPPLLVYLLLQKYIIRGISFTGLKG